MIIIKKKKKFVRKKQLRTNQYIRVPEVRVITPDGEKLVMRTQDAIDKAREYGLDLVEISPNATPPVCKIVEIGKYKYEMEKKSKESKKHQVNIVVKEIRMSPKIGEHDYQTKLNHIKKFFDHKYKVKVNIFFKGRLITHKDLGDTLAQKLLDDLQDFAVIENEPKLVGRSITLVFSPDSGGTKKKKKNDTPFEKNNKKFKIDDTSLKKDENSSKPAELGK